MTFFSALEHERVGRMLPTADFPLVIKDGRSTPALLAQTARSVVAGAMEVKDGMVRDDLGDPGRIAEHRMEHSAWPGPSASAASRRQTCARCE